MTEQYRPEVGHRVRMVIEGPVCEVGTKTFALGGKYFRLDPVEENVGGATVTYERLPDPLPALPTTVGSTVIAHGVVYALTDVGWRMALYGKLVDKRELAELVRDDDAPKITEAE